MARSDIGGGNFIAPTLVELTGLSVPGQFRGRSLLRARDAQDRGFAIGERTHDKKFREWFVREGDWRLVTTRSGERLFHLPSDPGEAVDLSGQRSVLAGYLAAKLWEYAPAFRTDAPILRPPGATLDDEERERVDDALRALTYIE